MQVRASHFFLRSTCFACVILFLNSCSNPFSDKLSEGTIHYTIDYPLVPEDNIMLDLMPKKMETSFEDNNYKTDIIAGMGLFKTSIIAKVGQENITHSVKMLNKKFASTLNHNDIEKINPELYGTEFKETGEKKIIAGYKCKEVIVLKDNVEKFKLYYTEEIEIENPNKSAPFERIPGVLMEYEMVNYDIHMHFIADEVFKKEITKEDLDIGEGYEMVSSDRLSKEMQSIFDKVK